MRNTLVVQNLPSSLKGGCQHLLLAGAVGSWLVALGRSRARGSVPEPGSRRWVRFAALRLHALLLAPRLMFNLFVFRYLRLFDIMGHFVWLSTVGEQPVGGVRLICCGGM